MCMGWENKRDDGNGTEWGEILQVPCEVALNWSFYSGNLREKRGWDGTGPLIGTLTRTEWNGTCLSGQSGRDTFKKWEGMGWDRLVWNGMDGTDLGGMVWAGTYSSGT